MRKNLVGRALVAGCCAVFVVGAVGACSDDSSDSAATASSSATPATPALSAADQKEITDAYVVFFNGKTPPAERAALIEDTAGFTPVLQGLAQDPQAQATTVTVHTVSAASAADQADVQYDLLLNGSPVMPDQAGQAVKVDGTWRVSAATFCALMAVQGGGAQVPACA